MLPRWFRVIVAAEIAGVVVAAVLLIHLLSSGVHAAGSVVSWARPHPAAASPPAVATPPPTPAASRRAPLPIVPAGLGALLNRGTHGEYTGEWALVQLFEAVLRDQAVALLGGSAARASPPAAGP